MERKAATPDWWLGVTYAITTFVSAFLLFQVQPLVSKHILPWFGGSSAVWTTCLLFFQTLLFGGYLYAHLSRRWLAPRNQAVAHLLLILAAVAMLRVLPGASWEPPDSYQPVARILAMLFANVGLPYFVLAATAPLIQAWFAQSFPGRIPYRLYALSNLGSLLALVSYPFFFERAFDLPAQASVWKWGFLIYALSCGAVATWLFRTPPVPLGEDKAEGKSLAHPAPSPEPSPEGREGHLHPRRIQYILWLLLPAFASIALLTTTNHVSTDIAVMPFLWVAPLALYLVTFILAFDHPRWYQPALIAAFTVVTVYGTALVNREGPGWIKLYECGTTGRCIKIISEAAAASGPQSEGIPLPVSPRFHVGFWPFLLLNFAALFGICMLCHGELFRRRPDPRHLTSYYLMIAAGGALGGLAVTLLAPQLFNTYFEWQIMMFGGAVVSLTLILHALVNTAVADSPVSRRSSSISTILLIVLLLPTALVLIDLVEYLAYSNRGVVLRTRNFFGMLAVREREADDPKDRALVLQHGIIAHGGQFTARDRRRLPATYYMPVSGIGLTFNFYRDLPRLGPTRTGVVGLGTGTVAAYVDPGDEICFYEINPAVIDIAESGRWFTYLKDCRERGAQCDVKLGDARLVLNRELRNRRPQNFHVLVLDAFSGDAIPVHLLTIEAFEIYLAHLSAPTGTLPSNSPPAGDPNQPSAGTSDETRTQSSENRGEHGALVVHISNRYLDLEPVVRAIAERLGLSMRRVRTRGDSSRFVYSAEWVILTRNESLLQVLEPYAFSERSNKPAILWTDSRSSLFDVLK